MYPFYRLIYSVYLSTCLGTYLSVHRENAKAADPKRPGEGAERAWPLMGDGGMQGCGQAAVENPRGSLVCHPGHLES